VHGYEAYAVRHQDYPAAIKKKNHQLDGFLLVLETKSQRKKLDDFEGKGYTPTSVLVALENGSTVDADMYVWGGDDEDLSTEPWKLEDFVEDSLESWIDLFEGMKLVGDSDDSE
jgi:hypothetical protein